MRRSFPELASATDSEARAALGEMETRCRPAPLVALGVWMVIALLPWWMVLFWINWPAASFVWPLTSLALWGPAVIPFILFGLRMHQRRVLRRIVSTVCGTCGYVVGREVFEARQTICPECGAVVEP